MLTTHNFRILNPGISQTPLCAQLKSEINKTIICSKTTELIKAVWAESPSGNHANIADNGNEIELARILSKEIFDNNILRPEYEFLPTLTDPLLHNIYAYTGDSDTDGFVALSPVPCSGLMHEIIERNKVNDLVDLAKQFVEVKPERISLHGPMIAQHEGIIRSFNLPYFQPMPVSGAKADKSYITLEFEIRNLNVSTGLIGVGLPAVTMFGIFISNFLQKESIKENDVGFAIGIHSIQGVGVGSNNGAIRKANIQGYLILEPHNELQASQLLTRLEADIKISGMKLHHKRIYVGNILPKAYWMKELDSEVLDILELEPQADSLDAAFYMVEESRLMTLVPMGFALFDRPKPVSHLPQVKYHHAFAEALFKSTELVYGDFQSSYLYKRKYKDGILTWEQN